MMEQLPVLIWSNLSLGYDETMDEDDTDEQNGPLLVYVFGQKMQTLTQTQALMSMLL